MTSIKNLDKLDRRLTTQDFVADPAGIFLREWQNFVHDAAVENAPEWHGDLKESIAEARDTSRFPLWARVYSDLPYARAMEEGSPPHWPPIEAVREWADDHGIPPFLVAKSIAEHGTEPRHFFADAEQEADRMLPVWMAEFARNVERQAARAA